MMLIVLYNYFNNAVYLQYFLSFQNYHNYSQKYWQELNLALSPKSIM